MSDTSRVDDILDVIDAGLQSSWESGYGTDYRPDQCVRCQCAPPVEDGSFCAGCRAVLLGDSDDGPSVVPQFTEDEALRILLDYSVSMEAGRRTYDMVRPARRQEPGPLRCFGGPKDGELLTIPGDRHVVLVPIPATISWSVDEPTDVMAPAIETARYDVEQFFMHDTRWCYPPLIGHTERCHTIARCLVAQGHDRQQITNQVNALIKITAVMAANWWTR